MSGPPAQRDPDAEPVGASAEQWIYGGIRVHQGKRIHAWLDPSGYEGLYRHKRAGHWVIGGYYTATVARDGDQTTLYGQPQYSGDGTAPDEVRRQLWAKDTAARTRLALLAQERKLAQRNAVDEALRPLISVARTLNTSADRDAFAAYVLRHLISAW